MPHQGRITEGRATQGSDAHSCPCCFALQSRQYGQAAGWAMYDFLLKARLTPCVHPSGFRPAQMCSPIDSPCVT